MFMLLNLLNVIGMELIKIATLSCISRLVALDLPAESTAARTAPINTIELSAAMVTLQPGDPA